MRRLADKGILLACGLTLLFYRPQVGAIDVAALLTAVTLCALGSYCGERFRLAAGILSEFDLWLPRFKKIIPHDYKRMLETTAAMEAKGLSHEQAEIEAFYANTRK